jgi:Ca2+-transporting ATPase
MAEQPVPAAAGQTGQSAVSPADLAALTPDEALAVLGSSPAGLSAAEAETRLRSVGPNVVTGRPGAGLVRRFARNFVHVLALLLWVAALFAFAGGLPELGWAIIAVVLINGVFTFAQEYRASRLLAALQMRLRGAARVRRDGAVVRVDAASLVPGDVIVLQEGDRVPADCRIISSAGLEVDQSALTGESLPVEKKPDAAGPGDLLQLAPIVYGGTLVARGDAEAVVFATGPRSQFGALTRFTYGTQQAEGPLEREVERLSLTTAVVAVAAGLVIWGISSIFLERSVREGLVFAIGVIVALVPEGLLPTLSLSLAIGAQRMARRNVLVRRLAAIEALGATDVICTDKTGTLTLNQLTVRKIWTPRAEYDLTGSGYEVAGRLQLVHGEPDEEGARRVLAAMALTCNAEVESVADGVARVSGDPTETAILVAARKVGVSPEAVRLGEIPFDSFRRLMSTIDRDGSGLTLHTKGAPDSVLARCAAAPASAAAAADAYAGQGMRVLAAARRRLDREPSEGDDPERGMEFLGLVGMVDPLRPEAVAAVAQARRAGVRVVIITGDHPGTAAAVAAQAGVTAGAPHVVLGSDIDTMSPSALHAALEREVVFARTTPVQKLRIVSALQDMGHVVAVIGDGVNDAPSLRRADVGVAMGLGGTDVAREAADIVLTDDNFATVIDAVEEGRAIFANIRKFVTYVFTSNVAELAPFAAYVLTGIPLPLKVLQVLAVDLGTDLIPALGLGAERPEPGVLDQPPRPRDEPLLNGPVFARIFLLLGPTEAALGLAGFFFVYLTHGWRLGQALADSGSLYELATTMTFSAIVVGQVGAVWACRSATRSILDLPLLGNGVLIAGVAIEVVVLGLIGRVPPLESTFGFRPLGWQEYLFLLACLPVLPFADEARKRLAATNGRGRAASDPSGP